MSEKQSIQMRYRAMAELGDWLPTNKQAAEMLECSESAITTVQSYMRRDGFWLEQVERNGPYRIIKRPTFASMPAPVATNGSDKAKATDANAQLPLQHETEQCSAANCSTPTVTADAQLITRQLTQILSALHMLTEFQAAANNTLTEMLKIWKGE